MKNKIQHIISATLIIIFLIISFASGGGEERCGCSTPGVTIPSYTNSWEDVKENWEYKDCAIAEGDHVAEKIHVYVYYNSKISKYRCKLLYSWPDNSCRMSSKIFGMEAISTADISSSQYKSGSWKTYNYWAGRQMY